MHDLHQMLVAQITSLSLLFEDSAETQTFYDSWLHLQATLSRALINNSVDQQTITLAHQVVSTIEVVASGFLELHERTSKITSDLENDLHLFFSELSLEDKPTVKTAKSKDVSPAPTALPAYIAPGYTWLLDNLHNPYPSKHDKSQIAEGTGYTCKDIDNWFRGIRKRIGWSELCKTRFSHKRNRIVEAATQFFKPRQMSLVPEAGVNSSTDQYSYDFVQIESSAKALYADKLFQTSLASSLANEAGDLHSTEKSELYHDQQRTSVQPENSFHSNPALSYPSPQSLSNSPLSSPSPASPLPLSGNSQSDTPRSSKRRRSMSETLEGEGEAYAPRDHKRSRISSCSTVSQESVAFENVSARMHLSPDVLPIVSSNNLISSSLVSSKNSHLPATIVTSLASPPSSPVAISVPLPSSSSKRKRRLSDADVQPPSKRLHAAMTFPRLQAVSNPFPLSNFPADDLSFGQWLQQSSRDTQNYCDTFPELGSAELLDSIGPIEVTYGYAVSPCAFDEQCEQLPMAPAAGCLRSSESASVSELQDLIQHPDLDYMALRNQLLDENVLRLYDSQELTLLQIDYLGSLFTGEEQSLTVVNDQLPSPPSPLTINQDDLCWNPLAFNSTDSSKLLSLSNNNDYLAHCDSTPELFSTFQPADPIISKQERVQFLREELRLLEADL